MVSNSDAVAPTVDGITLSNRSLQSTQNGYDLNNLDVRISASDNLSGIDSIALNFLSPSGGKFVQVWSDKNGLISGSLNNGLFRLGNYTPLNIFSEAGLYKFSHLSVTDISGNNSYYGSTELAKAGINPDNISFSIAKNGNSDAVAPAINNIVISKTSLTPSQNGYDLNNLGVRISASDNLSGIDSIALNFLSPSGGKFVQVWSDKNGLISGSLTNGLFALENLTPLNNFAEVGLYKFSHLSATDIAGNNAYYGPAELIKAGINPDNVSFSISKNGNADSIAPVINQITISNPSLKPSQNGYDLNSLGVRVSASDNLSGIDSIALNFLSPSGGKFVQVWSDKNGLVSGSLNNGSFLLGNSTPLNAFAEAGVYKFSHLSATDIAGNNVYYSSTELAKAGLDANKIKFSLYNSSLAPSLISQSAIITDSLSSPIPNLKIDGSFIYALDAINMLNINFSRVSYGAYNSNYSNFGKTISLNNFNYTNFLEIGWKYEDSFYESIFGGNNLTYAANGINNNIITGGVATGYLELKWNGASYDPQFLLQGFSLPAKELYNAFLTPSNTDDLDLIARALAGNDLLVGSDGNDSLAGFSGNDVYYGGKGDDTFVDLMNNGGQDWVVYTNQKSDYAITKNGEYFTVSDKVQNRDGIDKLYFIDRIEFAGHSIVALDLDGNAGQAYRLYKAALNRTPDERGLASWIKFMDDGGVLTAMSQQFIDSQEFRTKYGPLDNTGFVNQLYVNVLNRNGEPAGVAAWVGGLNNGLSRADVLKGFSESSENQANVIGQIKNGIAYTEWWLT